MIWFSICFCVCIKVLGNLLMLRNYCGFWWGGLGGWRWMFGLLKILLILVMFYFVWISLKSLNFLVERFWRYWVLNFFVFGIVIICKLLLVCFCLVNNELMKFEFSYERDGKEFLNEFLKFCCRDLFIYESCLFEWLWFLKWMSNLMKFRYGKVNLFYYYRYLSWMSKKELGKGWFC